MKIVCIGRNYLAHIQELRNAVPDAPVIFFKTADSIIEGNSMPYPSFTNDLHYECEVVLRVHTRVVQGSSITDIQACCDAWTVGIDFTARDVQDGLKAKGLPWELAKSFKNATMLGTWQAMPSENIYETTFHLHRNGVQVQEGQLSHLIHNFEAIVNYCSRFIDLNAGDIIFTGTPAGVGTVAVGDCYEGFLQGKRCFELQVI